MLSKIWLINIVLAVCIVLMGMNAWLVWTGEVPKQKVPAKAQSPADASGQKRTEKPKAPESEYSVIAEKNLFDPTRKEALPEEGESAAPGEKKPDAPRQNIVLYGVILMKDYQKALIQTPEGGSAKNRWVKVGETIGDMTVSAIEKERILLAEGEKIHEISLHEGKKHGAGGPAASKTVSKTDAPNIINISASANDPPKEGSPESPKPEAKPPVKEDSGNAVKSAQGEAPAGAKEEKAATPPVAVPDKNKKAEPAPSSDTGKGGSPVFGGGPTSQETPKESNNKGNAEENKVINPFLQLLQRKN